MRIKKETKEEQHRAEEEQRIEDARVKTERKALESASAMLEGITFGGEKRNSLEVQALQKKADGGSRSSRGSKHSRTSSVNIVDLNSAMLMEMYQGPMARPSNIVMIDGKIMSEQEASQYAYGSQEDVENQQRGSFGEASVVSKTFEFLNRESDNEDNDMHEQEPSKPQVCKVEINLQAPTPGDKAEEFFGDKIDGSVGVKTD
jgi:hypothetical protein